jgi:hypothetical protein
MAAPHIYRARDAGRWPRRTPKGLAPIHSDYAATLPALCGDEPIERRAARISERHVIAR